MVVESTIIQIITFTQVEIVCIILQRPWAMTCSTGPGLLRDQATGKVSICCGLEFLAGLYINSASGVGISRLLC
jgi:hypothetical protein